MGLSAPVRKAIAELGFETPSEIQQKAIPELIPSFRDFIGLAQTGTGKTAAFGLPLVEQVDPDGRHTQALILTPTRELGQQVAAQLEQFSKYLDDISVMAVYGGAPINRQINQLKQPQQIIIATPGRLIDLMKRGSARLDRISYLVLDEADEMLNMGFKDDLDWILRHTPKDKVTWLFSATMEKEIRRIANEYMDDPTEVRINPKQELNTNIDHKYFTVRRKDKKEALVRYLDLYPDMRGIIFTRTKREAKQLAAWLEKRNFSAGALQGNMSQAQRDRVMGMFRAEEIHLLIATDIAARGIDVSRLSHVIHFDLPDEKAYYTHRSGRTARAGHKGISLAIIDERNVAKLKDIQRSLKMDFERIRVPDGRDILTRKLEAWSHRLIDQPVMDEMDQELLSTAEGMFYHLSKEELIARLVSRELAGRTEQLSDLNSDPRDWGELPKEPKRGGGGGRRQSNRRSGNYRKGGGNNRGGGHHGGRGRSGGRRKSKR